MEIVMNLWQRAKAYEQVSTQLEYTRDELRMRSNKNKVLTAQLECMAQQKEELEKQVEEYKKLLQEQVDRVKELEKSKLGMSSSSSSMSQQEKVRKVLSSFQSKIEKCMDLISKCESELIIIDGNLTEIKYDELD